MRLFETPIFLFYVMKDISFEAKYIAEVMAKQGIETNIESYAYLI